MREILFRGKRKDHGEWVYGSYAYQYGCHEILLPEVESEYGFDHYAVDPSTIGQYTGLTDKSGNKKIFEGDILEDYSYERYIIEYNEYCAAFQLTTLDGYSEGFLESINHEHMSIIGTVHDNPELLEAQHE